MTSKTALLLLFAMSYFTSQAQTLPDAVSLEEAIAFGEQNNRTVKKASMEVQKAYKEKWSTIAIGLPQISPARIIKTS